MYHQIVTIIIWIHMNYSVDQKLKMSEMLMAIFMVYSTSDITSGKKFVGSSKWRPFWNIKHSFNLTSDIKISSQIMPPKKVFSWRLYRWRHRVASKFLSIFIFRRGWLRDQIAKGNVSSIYANIVIVFLGYTCQKTISMNYTFRDCRSKVNIKGLLDGLGTNKQHCKLSQIQLFF